jgi:hypothetical protein
LRSRPAIEKKKADAEHAMTGAQSQVESHKDTLANLQASYDRLGWYSKRLPRAAGQFPSNNVQCSRCDCATSEYLNAPVMYNRIGRSCNIFLQFASFLLRTFRYNAERPIRQRNANSRMAL